MSTVTEGYRRVQAQLSGPSYWSAFEHVAGTTSTNDVAAARAREGAPGGLVVVADRQSAGRGRAGRAWVDPQGGREDASLLVSFLVGVPPTGVTLVPLAIGVAVADALHRQGVDASLKWPNDVLVQTDHLEAPAKCAGILAERHEDPTHGGFLVLGVGVDVDWRGTERTGEAAGWTSLAEVLGADVDRWDVLADLMRSLSAWLLDVPRDPSRLLDAYRGRCRTLGLDIRATTPGGEIVGRAVALDPDGGLVVDTADGTVTVTAGDVEHVRPA